MTTDKSSAKPGVGDAGTISTGDRIWFASQSLGKPYRKSSSDN
jgi:hypothetical protein